MSKKVILIVIIAIGIVLAFAVVRNGVLLKQSGLNTKLKIGKELYINVADNEIIDADYLSKVANGTYDSAFALMDSKEMHKLIQYLKENNLLIEPGKYVINQAWSFEKVKDILRFKKR
ncbi:MAG TPA: hypothetical protein PK768_07810 [Tepidanaerobacteraceae bacterium]|jgi:hypothetical protein|nr:hypothetical protein [Tepidanaerobacteraceae bacterium]